MTLFRDKSVHDVVTRDNYFFNGQCVATQQNGIVYWIHDDDNGTVDLDNYTEWAETAPQETVYVGDHYELTNQHLWIDDGYPADANAATSNETMSWVASNPKPLSGEYAHKSPNVAGMHQHYFDFTSQPVNVGVGDVLFAYVYVDPANPPSEIMLQFHSPNGLWEHRAYWGANLLTWGTDGTNSRRQACSCLPQTGTWVKLEIPAWMVGMEGLTMDGMAFSLYNGSATWDRAGVRSSSINMATKYYFFGGQRVAMRNKTGLTFIHGDMLGSASLATSSTGGKISELRYKPFGEVRLLSNQTGTDRTFTGQRVERGIGNILDYGGRFYDPLIARFLSADTVVPGAGNPQAFNRYSYVFNNPLGWRDPSGHDPNCSDQACWEKRWYEAHGYECQRASCRDGEWSLTGYINFADKEILDDVLHEAGIYFADGDKSWLLSEKKLIGYGVVALGVFVGGMVKLHTLLGDGWTKFIRGGDNADAAAETLVAYGQVTFYENAFSGDAMFAMGTSVHELGHIIDSQGVFIMSWGFGGVGKYSTNFPIESELTDYTKLTVNTVQRNQEYFAEALTIAIYGSSYRSGDTVSNPLSSSQFRWIRGMLNGWGP